MSYRLIKNLEGDYNRKLYQGDSNQPEDFPPVLKGSITPGSQLHMLTGEKYKLNSQFQWQLLPADTGGGGSGTEDTLLRNKRVQNSQGTTYLGYNTEDLITARALPVKDVQVDGVSVINPADQAAKVVIPVTDIKIDGNTIVNSKVADIPLTSTINTAITGKLNKSDVVSPNSSAISGQAAEATATYTALGNKVDKADADSYFIDSITGTYNPTSKVFDIETTTKNPSSGVTDTGIFSIPAAKASTGGILTPEMFNSLFAPSDYTIYVDKNSIAANEIGTEAEPYKELQDAINDNNNNLVKTIIIKSGSVFTSTITVPSTCVNTSIVSESDISGLSTVSLSGGINIDGDIIGLKGLSIQNINTDGTLFIENCKVNNITTSAGGHESLIQNSEITGNIIISSDDIVYCETIDLTMGGGIIDVLSNGSCFVNNSKNIRAVNESGLFYCTNTSFAAQGNDHVYKVTSGNTGSVSILASGTTALKDGTYAPIAIEAGTYSIGNTFDYNHQTSSLTGATKIPNSLINPQGQLLDANENNLTPGTKVYSVSEVNSLVSAAGGTGTIGVYTFAKLSTATTNPVAPAVSNNDTLYDFQAGELYKYISNNWTLQTSPTIYEGCRIDVFSYLDGASATGVDMVGLDGFAIYFDSDWHFFCDSNNTVTFDSTIPARSPSGERHVQDITTPANITEDYSQFTTSELYTFPDWVLEVIGKFNGFKTEIDKKFELTNNKVPISILSNDSTHNGMFLKSINQTPTWATISREDMKDRTVVLGFSGNELSTTFSNYNVNTRTNYEHNFYWKIGTPGAPSTSEGYGTIYILPNDGISFDYRFFVNDLTNIYTWSGILQSNDSTTYPDWKVIDTDKVQKIIIPSGTVKSANEIETYLNNKVVVDSLNASIKTTGSKNLELRNVIGDGIVIDGSSFDDNSKTIMLYDCDNITLTNDQMSTEYTKLSYLYAISSNIILNYVDVPNLYIHGGSTVTLRDKGVYTNIAIDTGGILAIENDFSGTVGTNIHNNGGTVIDRRNNNIDNVSTYQPNTIKITSFQGAALQTKCPENISYDIQWDSSTPGAPNTSPGYGRIRIVNDTGTDRAIKLITAVTPNGEYKFAGSLTGSVTPTWILNDGSNRVEKKTITSNLYLTPTEAQEFLNNTYLLTNSARTITVASAEAAGLTITNCISDYSTITLGLEYPSTSSSALNFKNCYLFTVLGGGRTVGNIYIGNSTIQLSTLSGSSLNLSQGATVTLISSGDYTTVIMGSGSTLVIPSNFNGSLGIITNNGGTVIDKRIGPNLNVSTYAPLLMPTVSFSSGDYFTEILQKLAAIGLGSEKSVTFITNGLNLGLSALVYRITAHLTGTNISFFAQVASGNNSYSSLSYNSTTAKPIWKANSIVISTAGASAVFKLGTLPLVDGNPSVVIKVVGGSYSGGNNFTQSVISYRLSISSGGATITPQVNVLSDCQSPIIGARIDLDTGDYYLTNNSGTSIGTYFTFQIESIITTGNATFSPTQVSVPTGNLTPVVTGNFINNNYTIAEIDTGKSYNGVKIYRRTFNGNINMGPNNLSVVVLANGIADIIDCGGWWMTGISNYKIPLFADYASASSHILTGTRARAQIYNNNGQIILESESDTNRAGTTSNAYNVWVEYTK